MGFDWLIAVNLGVELVAHQLKELLLGAVRRGHSFKFEQIAYKCNFLVLPGFPWCDHAM